MIPGGFVAGAESPFLPPASDPYDPLTQRVWGGTALNNGANGRLVQLWQVSYSDPVISVGLPASTPAFTLSRPGLTSVSLAFDQNMAPVLAWQTSAGTTIYFFNGTTYEELLVPGTTSSRAVVDDLRAFNAANSDIIVAYTRAGSVWYRQQRDNYAIERLIGSTSTAQLIRLGTNVAGRLQLELIQD